MQKIGWTSDNTCNEMSDIYSVMRPLIQVQNIEGLRLSLPNQSTAFFRWDLVDTTTAIQNELKTSLVYYC